MSEKAKTQVCQCNHCSEKIEFEVGQSGQVVQCPHCGLETTLFAKVVRRTTLVSKKKWFGRGVEAHLDAIAKAMFLIGVFLFLSWLFNIMTGTNNKISDPNSTVVCFVTSIGSFISYFVFRAFADVIRLLKKIGGLQFDGEVSSSFERVKECSACGGKVLFENLPCPKCGAEFENEN